MNGYRLEARKVKESQIKNGRTFDSRIYYVRLINPQTNKRMSARSTGTSSRYEAEKLGAEWALNGYPPKKGKQSLATSGFPLFTYKTILETVKVATMSPDEAGKIVEILRTRGLLDKQSTWENKKLNEQLLEFWNYETSPYVLFKKSQTKPVTKRHMNNGLSLVKNHWVPYWGEKLLGDLSAVDLQKFITHLTGKGLKEDSRNKVIACGKTFFAWAMYHELLSKDPFNKFFNTAAKPLERGILNEEERAKLWALNWGNKPAYYACMVGLVTGLRLGEIRALKIQDIFEDRIEVRHNWSDTDGLKLPKNGETRTCPITAKLYKDLVKLHSCNPFNNDFIFFSLPRIRPNPSHKKVFTIVKHQQDSTPLGESYIREAFYKAMKKIEITEESRIERNLVFHSLRHTFASAMANIVDERTLQLATGHKTPLMAEHYAKHREKKHVAEVRAALVKIFPKLEE